MSQVPLFHAPAVVMVARPPTLEPAVVVGAANVEPIGNCVAIGASASVEGVSLAFIAHVAPEMARQIAAKLIASAEEVEASGGGDPLARGREAAARAGLSDDGPAFILPGGARLSEKGQDSPPISEATAVGGDQFQMAQPEFLGIRTQVQHPTQSGKPPTHEPGVLGATMMSAPDGLFRVVLGMTHADGTSLAAILSAEDYVAFSQCYDEAGKILAQPMGKA